MKNGLKLSTALAGLALIAMVGSAGAGEVLDRILADKTLVMATDAAYPPQSFQNADGAFEGFDIDVGREIAKRLGVELKLVTPAWEAITAGKWGGRWDVSVGSMTPTEQRAEVLDFAAVYYYTPASFAVHTDNSGASAPGDLSGKKIGVCGGCTYENYLNKNLVIDAEGAPPFEYQVDAGEIRTYETDNDAFEDLRLGDGVRIDAVLSALPTIQAAIDSGFPMKAVGEPVFYEPLAVAMDKGDGELVARIARIIDAMHGDGTLSDLSVKWYGVDLTSAKMM